MELRQLKYFVKTAETLNFSEAARLLFVTQSTLSQQIRQLEEELDVALFQRDSHSVRLTESGEHLLPCAKATLQDAEQCLTRINDLKAALSGTLNIGITYSFVPILSETVKIFTNQYPGVKLNIVCRNMEIVLDMLKRRDLDFVLCYKPDYQDEEMESHALFDENLCAIMSKDHPLAKRESLTIVDLLDQSMALPSKDTQARQAFDRTYPGIDDKMHIQVEMNSVNVLLDLVRETKMITILSQAALYHNDALVAVPLDNPPIQMEGCVHTLRKTYRKRAAEEFIRILGQSNAVMVRANNWLK